MIRELLRPRVRGDPVIHSPRKPGESDALSLPEHQIRERCAEFRPEEKLRSVLPLCAVRHRAAAIEQKGAVQVRLFIVFFNVRTIGASEHAPVEPAGIVARDVKPVLAKLDARSLHRAAVQAHGCALDDISRRYLKLVEPLDELGLEIPLDETHGF